MEAEIPAPRETPADRLLQGVGSLQGFAKAVLASFSRPYFRLKVEGVENVPRSGPLVLISNHESMWDVPLLVIAFPRPMIMMAKEAVHDTWYKDWFFSRLGSFPVERGSKDLQAMKRALAVVRSGKVLALFPEGTRHREGGLLPFLPGAAWIALAEGVPILPAAVHGTGRISPRGLLPIRRIPIRVTLGKPIAVEREASPRARREKSVELTTVMRDRVERMLRPTV